ncbi:MAG: gamma-glutamyltransferase [Bacteroidetes bacterium]|nr:gamma-glutamyltransferase [Bacteroidota bacterium]
MRVLLCALWVLLLSSCQQKSPSEYVYFKKAALVSSRIEASEIGVQILKEGGNAFDAMIATELALAVAYPFAGNISGGGFMVFRKADGSAGSLDYREMAPMAAKSDFFLDAEGSVITDKSTLGANAVGIPGTVAGIFAVYDSLASLPFERLIQPAIDLARKGVVVTTNQSRRLAYYDSLFTLVNQRVLHKFSGVSAGDTIKHIELAKTLELIRDKGRAGFYEGKMAEKITSFIQRNGGVITLEDLKAYRAVFRDPILFSFKNFDLISMAPPSSGGLTMQQIFGMLEPFVTDDLTLDSEEYIHLLTETFRRAYADRNHFLGDPDFVAIPEDKITATTYLKSRMESFDPETATPSEEISHGEFYGLESEETTHYSIIDSFGNAVSVTTTLNGGYGSKLYHEELGFFYNNEMDDFGAKPGVPNMFGLVGSSANEIAPRKRMLSSMTPTIVEKDGELFMVLGTPGGSTIITAVAQTFMRAAYYDQPMQESVDAPRFHHQWMPDRLILEPNRYEEYLVDRLKEKGHNISEQTNRIIGKVNAIKVHPIKGLEAGADSRGDEAASGF